MSRRHQKPLHKPSKPIPRPTGNQGLGLKAFHLNNYGEAIRLWSEVEAGTDPAVRAALAEAHFRRALATRVSLAEAVADLRRAVELLPEEERFWYQLGLMLHRSDCLEEARQAYARAAELGLARRGIGVVRGLAELEVDPQLSLDTLPWLSPEARTALLPISALLRGEPLAASAQAAHDTASKTPSLPNPVTSLWQGLNLLASGQASAAYTVLAPPKGQRLPVGAEPIRAFYFGVAAALAGKPQVALSHWREMMRLSPQSAAARPPRMNAYVSQISAHSILALQQEGQWEEAFKQAQSGVELAPGNVWLIHAVLIAANRLAVAAREAGDWDGALDRWEIVRSILEKRPDLGALPPILHNLAIAYEATEEWEEAANTWAALLNTLPSRRGGRTPKNPVPASAGPSIEEKRAWMRRRILDNYQRADLPEEAITYYKQAVKADPENLELRLEMASALLANEQVIAGRNEVQRILDKDPEYVPALLLLAEIHQSRGENYAAEIQLSRVLKIDPSHDTARKALREMILERGMNAHNSGRFQQALEIYTQALTYTPNDPQLLIFMGQSEEALGRAKKAQAHFDAALAVGTLQAYIMLFSLWARSLEEKKARDIVARAEAAGLGGHEFYLSVGTVCLTRAGRFDPSVASRNPQVQTVWEPWGRELIEKGLDCAPDRAEVLQRLLMVLGPEHGAIAVGYARELVALKPDNPEYYIDLALCQAFAKDVAGAKKTLTEAERVARKQGRKDLIGKIADLRQDIGSPFFSMMGSLIGKMGMDELDLEDEEFY